MRAQTEKQSIVGSSVRSAFYTWMEARHDIYERRAQGRKPPWTDDPILASYRFCNVYRELDKNTVQLREINRMGTFGIFVYRLFNRHETFEECGLDDWASCRRKLTARNTRGDKVFTAAHFSCGGRIGFGKSCFDMTVKSLERVRCEYRQLVGRHDTLRGAFDDILSRKFIGIGRFFAYEIVTDLRWRPYFWKNKRGPTDAMLWANIGPGSRRGLQRLNMPVTVGSIRTLLQEYEGPLKKLEMREIEHSLCEFDKYERIRLKQGVCRQVYRPTA